MCVSVSFKTMALQVTSRCHSSTLTPQPFDETTNTINLVFLKPLCASLLSSDFTFCVFVCLCVCMFVWLCVCEWLALDISGFPEQWHPTAFAWGEARTTSFSVLKMLHNMFPLSISDSITLCYIPVYETNMTESYEIDIRRQWSDMSSTPINATRSKSHLPDLS